ncbi:T-cell surface glycoprotein CD4-like [Heterodontus francisci]|uniref:T-cell surface glycoprotein CD4-like n=1 Tax=Heterodontus francisci TaxID=7792 RepID=UPI00355C96B4
MQAPGKRHSSDMLAPGPLCGTLLIFLALLEQGVGTASSPVVEGDDIYVTEGATVTFPCTMNYRQQKPITNYLGGWSWTASQGAGPLQKIIQFLHSSMPQRLHADFQSRIRISSLKHHGDFSLSLSNVRAQDAGSFICDFTHPGYKAEATKRLHVIRVISNSPNPALEGDNITLSCLTALGQVKWRGPSVSDWTEKNLPLLGIKVEDRGSWVCSVEFKKGFLEARYALDIVGFSSPSDQVIYIESQKTAILPCVLNQFPSTRPVQGGWHLHDKELLSMNVSGSSWGWNKPQDHRLKLLEGLFAPTSLSVLFKVSEPSDGGKYSCHLTVRKRTISRTVTVSVIEVKLNEPGTVMENSNISLSCLVSDNSHLTEIRWYHRNSNRSLGTAGSRKRTSDTIKLTAVSKREAGTWVCEIYHGIVVKGRATYKLTVTDAPHRLFTTGTMIITIGTSSAAVAAILIATLIGVFLAKRARRRRRAVRRLRHPLCREHSHQLSTQPLYNGNDYIQTDRPLPPPPVRYCPHNQPRRGRPSQTTSSR